MKRLYQILKTCIFKICFMWVSMCECRLPWSLKDVRSPDVGVTGSSEVSDGGAGTRTQVPCQSSMCCELLSLLETFTYQIVKWQNMSRSRFLDIRTALKSWSLWDRWNFITKNKCKALLGFIGIFLKLAYKFWVHCSIFIHTCHPFSTFVPLPHCSPHLPSSLSCLSPSIPHVASVMAYML